MRRRDLRRHGREVVRCGGVVGGEVDGFGRGEVAGFGRGEVAEVLQVLPCAVVVSVLVVSFGGGGGGELARCYRVAVWLPRLAGEVWLRFMVGEVLK